MTELEILKWAAYGILCKIDKEHQAHKSCLDDDSVEAFLKVIKEIPKKQKDLYEKVAKLETKFTEIALKIEQIKMPSEHLELFQQAYQLECEIEQMKIDSNGQCAKLKELVRNSNAHEEYFELVQQIHKKHLANQYMVFCMDQKVL